MYPEKTQEELEKICPDKKRLSWAVCFKCGYHGKPNFFDKIDACLTSLEVK